MRVHEETALDMTGISGTQYSNTIKCEHIYGLSADIRYDSATDSQNTDVTIEISNDNIEWSEVSTFRLDDRLGYTMVNLPEIMYKLVRFKFVNTVGPVDIVVTCYKKGV